ncbi:hypothetical protein GW17_00044780, partial [Ensete ventricosum]
TLLEKLKSLYSNLEGLPPDRIVPTVGLNIGRVEASNAKLVFWDLGGQVYNSPLQTDVPISAFMTQLRFTSRNRTGIKFAINWLVDVMERSKRAEMLRVRAGVAGQI